MLVLMDDWYCILNWHWSFAYSDVSTCTPQPSARHTQLNKISCTLGGSSNVTSDLIPNPTPEYGQLCSTTPELSPIVQLVWLLCFNGVSVCCWYFTSHEKQPQGVPLREFSCILICLLSSSIHNKYIAIWLKHLEFYWFVFLDHETTQNYGTVLGN